MQAFGMVFLFLGSLALVGGIIRVAGFVHRAPVPQELFALAFVLLLGAVFSLVGGTYVFERRWFVIDRRSSTVVLCERFLWRRWSRVLEVSALQAIVLTTYFNRGPGHEWLCRISLRRNDASGELVEITDKLGEDFAREQCVMLGEYLKIPVETMIQAKG